jgi:hypothetical protein
VRVPYGEGVANHIGPEPCVANDEASVGECISQPLSRERIKPGCRRCAKGGRQYGRARKSRAPRRPSVVKDPGVCRRSLSLGTGRARARPLGLRPPVRVRKARSRS